MKKIGKKISVKALCLISMLTLLVSVLYVPMSFGATAAVIPVENEQVVTFSFEDVEGSVEGHWSTDNMTKGDDGVGCAGWSMRKRRAANGVKGIGFNYENVADWVTSGGYRLNNKDGVYNLEASSTYVVSFKLSVLSAPFFTASITTPATSSLKLGYGFTASSDGNTVGAMKTTVSDVFTAARNSYGNKENATFKIITDAGVKEYTVGQEQHELTYVFTTPKDLGEGAEASLGFFAHTYYGLDFIIDDVKVTKLSSSKSAVVLIDEYYGSTQVLTGEKGSAVELPMLEGEDSDHEFLGWFKDANRTEKAENMVFGEEKTVLFSNWKAFVTITFVDTLNGKNYEVVGTAGEPIEYPADPIDTVNDPQKEWFMGWYTTESCTEEYTEKVFGYSDYSVYAKWLSSIPDQIQDFENYNTNVYEYSYNYKVMSVITDPTQSGRSKVNKYNWDVNSNKYDTNKYNTIDNIIHMQGVALEEGTIYTTTFDYYVENLPEDVKLTVLPVSGAGNNIWQGVSVNFASTQGAKFAITNSDKDGKWHKGSFSFTMKYGQPNNTAIFLVMALSQKCNATVYIDNVVFKAAQPYESTITYVHNNGTADKTVIGVRGEEIPEYIPVGNGRFLGWFTDETCTVAFEKTVFERLPITVYAGWPTIYTFENDFPYNQGSSLQKGELVNVVEGEGVGLDDNFKLNFKAEANAVMNYNEETGVTTYWSSKMRSSQDNCIRLDRLENHTAYKLSYYYKTGSSANVNTTITFATCSEGNTWEGSSFKSYSVLKNNVSVDQKDWVKAEVEFCTDFASNNGSMLFIMFSAADNADGCIAEIDIDNITIDPIDKPYIYYEPKNGTTGEIIKGKVGDKIGSPLENPTKFGYIFSGWYLDKECSIPFTKTHFSKNDNLFVYAKYVKATYVVYDLECFNFAKENEYWFLWDTGNSWGDYGIAYSGTHAFRFDRNPDTGATKDEAICVGYDKEVYKLERDRKYAITFKYYIKKSGSANALVSFKSGAQHNHYEMGVTITSKFTINTTEKEGVWHTGALIADASICGKGREYLFLQVESGLDFEIYFDDIEITTLPEGHTGYVVDNGGCDNVPMYVTGKLGSSFANQLPTSPKYDNHKFQGYKYFDSNNNIDVLTPDKMVFTEEKLRIKANFVRLKTVMDFEDGYKSLLESHGDYSAADYDYELYDATKEGNSKDNVTSGKYALHRKGTSMYFENAQLVTQDKMLSNTERYTITMKVKLGKHFQTDGAIKIASARSPYYAWTTTGDYHSIVAIKDLVDGEWHEVSYTFNSVEAFLAIQTPGYCELFIDDVVINWVEKDTPLSSSVSYTEYVPAKRDANGNLVDVPAATFDVESIVNEILLDINAKNSVKLNPIYILIGSVILVLLAVSTIIIIKKRKIKKAYGKEGNE